MQDSILATNRRGRPERPATLALLVVVIIGIAVNFTVGVMLDQVKLFYPIDRLRLSMGVALSRLRDPPISGYVAYGSIDRYLQESGFSYEHDASEIRKLLSDNGRIEDIWRQALTMKLDPSLPNAVFGHSDVGYADFVSGSFLLFGMHPTSLYWFYCMILCISSALFLVCFWRSAPALWMLGTYLACHLLSVFYVTGVGSIASIANTRAMTTLALLPVLHLIVQSASKAKLTPGRIASSCGQCLILGFILFCRFDVVILVLAGLGALALAVISAAVKREAAARAHDLRARTVLLLLAIAIFGGLQLRQTLVLRDDYTKAPERHLVWDSFLSSILTYDPQLFAEYSGKPAEQEHLWDEDQIPCVAILHYYEQKFGKPFSGDCTVAPPPGLGGQYDQLGFELSMKILRAHPAAIFTLFERSPRQQISIWALNRELDLRHAYPALILAAVVLLAFAASRASPIAGFNPILLVAGMLLLLGSALADPLIVPSPDQSGALAMLFFSAALVCGGAVAGAAQACRARVAPGRVSADEARYLSHLDKRNS